MSKFEALISEGWEQKGMAEVIVVRWRNSLSLDFGVFLVDVWCLGVKDAFAGLDYSKDDYDDFVQNRPAESVPIEPACAKKLIEGAIAYADRLGFAPHPDFRKARRVLSGLDAAECPTEFTFGRDGRPCYLRGPNDSDERAHRVRSMLEARLGPDGFTFFDTVEEEDEFGIARQQLMDFVREHSDVLPPFPMLSGVVTAALMCPTPVPPLECLKLIFEPEDGKPVDETMLLGLTERFVPYWNGTADIVQSASYAEELVDVWADDWPDKESLTVAMIDWVAGFMMAVEEWSDAWAPVRNRPELAPEWELLGWWQDIEQEGNLERATAATKANPPRTIITAVAAIRQASRG